MGRCIFCKLDNTSFTSVEHIIPQSIGNLEHILPVGVVCDSCNNYFSRKVENKFINSEIILDIRRKMSIPNRHGKIPTNTFRENPKIPEQRYVARFLGKVGLEVLAKKAMSIPNWENEVIDKPELDELRNFTRYNILKGEKEWPFYSRTLHPVNTAFFDGKETYEVLHEYDLLYTIKNELFLVLSVFGVEFTINFGGPCIDGYKEWLVENEYASPLYFGKNNPRI